MHHVWLLLNELRILLGVMATHFVASMRVILFIIRELLVIHFGSELVTLRLCILAGLHLGHTR